MNAIFMVSPRDGATDPWFLLGWLNSAIVRVTWLERFSDRRQTFPKVKGGFLERLPVPKANAPDQKKIADVARELASEYRAKAESTLPAKRAQHVRKIEALELSLDKLCGALVGLSSQESDSLLKVLS